MVLRDCPSKCLVDCGRPLDATCRRPMAARCPEPLQPGGISGEPNYRSRGNDDREWHGKEENTDKVKCGERKHSLTFQRTPANPHDRFEDHREHRRLQTKKQCLDGADIAESGINP